MWIVTIVIIHPPSITSLSHVFILLTFPPSTLSLPLVIHVDITCLRETGFVTAGEYVTSILHNQNKVSGVNAFFRLILCIVTCSNYFLLSRLPGICFKQSIHIHVFCKTFFSSSCTIVCAHSHTTVATSPDKTSFFLIRSQISN